MLSSIPNTSVALSLEAQGPLIGVFDGILREGLAVLDKPVHVKAAKNNRPLGENASFLTVALPAALACPQ